jgi:hypothetical protein
MCIYNITHPSRRKPIGQMWTTLGQAKRAAQRAAKRFGHANITHWRNGHIMTVFNDGTLIKHHSK